MNARLDPIIERFRFSHHNVAMMFAMGMAVQEIARRTGFTQRRLMILLDDPTFNELIEHYRSGHLEHFRQAIPDAMEMMATAHLTTLRQINEYLEEADEEGGERLPINTLVKIHDSMADRTGYSKHTVKTVLSVDFATALDRCIERSGKGPELKLIEGGLTPLRDDLTPQRSPLSATPPRTFRRA